MCAGGSVEDIVDVLLLAAATRERLPKPDALPNLEGVDGREDASCHWVEQRHLVLRAHRERLGTHRRGHRRAHDDGWRAHGHHHWLGSQLLHGLGPWHLYHDRCSGTGVGGAGDLHVLAVRSLDGEWLPGLHARRYRDLHRLHRHRHRRDLHAAVAGNALPLGLPLRSHDDEILVGAHTS